MNRQDEKMVAAANTWLKSLGDFSQWYKDSCNAPTITSLLNIIDRLDKQLANLVEAGEPFVRFYGRILYMKDENMELTIPPPDEHIDKVTYKEWGRLAQALKGVDVLKDSAGCYVSGLNDDGRVMQKFLKDIRCPKRR